MTKKTGTFVVTAADPESAVLRDVSDSQVHTLSSNPEFEESMVVEATLAPEPPMNVTWEVEDVADRRRIEMEHVDLAVTGKTHDVARATPEGQVETYERAGDGEIHVLSVPEGTADEAAADVLADEATLERAARLGAVRVEVRTDADVVSVRYLPK